jgi:hypothetical protein
MEETWIASEDVVFLYANGRRVPGRIAVGLPVQIDATEASCMIALDGFQYQTHQLRGTSTLQAVLMAVRFIGWRLHDFLSKGGRVLDPEEEDADFPIEALFGPLLRQATGVSSDITEDPDEPSE